MRTIGSRSTPTRGLAALVALCVLLAPMHALAKRKLRPSLPATLVIYSLTEGARVEIDGKAVGTIPLDDDFAVEVGDHTIRVSKLGYSEHNDTFTARSGGEVELEIDLIPVAGIVTINSNAKGATVKVDGKVLGVTPFIDQEVSPGTVVLSVEAPGYEPFLEELKIVAGQLYTVVGKLKRIPAAMQPDIAGGADGPAFYDTWWFWTIMGTVVVSTTALAITLGQPEVESSAGVFERLCIGCPIEQAGTE
jgi:hypothetical protein